MSTTFQIRLATAAVAAIAAVTMAAPAYAGPHVDVEAPAQAAVTATVQAPECQTAINEIRRGLRAAGFSSAAARAFAELTRRDCLEAGAVG